VEGCKTKDYEIGNAVLALKRLKKKCVPVPPPSKIKMEVFREDKLNKGGDPENRKS
jgi:hypothetical protein